MGALTLRNIDVTIVISERFAKITIGSRFCISATWGEKMVTSLPKKLHMPNAVAAKSTGNKSKLQR